MAEYFEREAAIRVAGYATDEHPYSVEKGLVLMTDLYNKGWSDACDYIRDKLGSLSAAEVAPVVHGRWAHLGGDEWCCSACGFVVTTEGSWDTPTKKYCEDCGARMDGDDDAKAD